MKDELSTPGAVVGSVVLACLFGGLALAIYPGWVVVGAYLPAPPNWSEWMAAAAALGSCAAAGIALWIAMGQSRKEARKDMEVARLYASSMISRLRHAHDHVASANAKIAFSDRAAFPADTFLSVRDRLALLAYRPSIEELKALAPLPGYCASRIARAFDHVDAAREQLTDFLSLSDRSFGRTYLAGSCRSSVWEKLTHAMRLLDAAMPEVERAAEAGSPPPSQGELHGEWSDSDL